ncbi:hypothetical protein [Halorussus halophilus]|uniref:hypothetical protein n=1 Tax=Halorussus halophilus TaxID=2650975 RepID=UPI0017877DED|nr:hypothetical protein [Halorussus halophilus]
MARQFVPRWDALDRYEMTKYETDRNEKPRVVLQDSENDHAWIDSSVTYPVTE